jgi:RimJ/RimL family protein N-acetyltransferase
MIDQPILVDDTVTIRPQTAADAPLLFEWFYDPDVLPWLQLSEDPPQYRTLEGVQERFERLDADPSTLLWRIDTADGQPIGEIGLYEIHPLQKRAEIHLCIGGTGMRGQGYGTHAIRLLMNYAFTGLKLRRVFLIVDEDNLRAIRSYEKSGFRREGLLRAHRLRFGQPVNMLLMGRLAEDEAPPG